MFNLNESDKEFILKMWEKLDEKLSIVANRTENKIPATAVNGVFDDMGKKDISWWTNGFWPGLMWLMYVGTKKEIYSEVANNAEILLDEALKDYDSLHHDVGFMWHISSGVNYRLTKNKASKVRNLYAANILAGRYNIKGKYIRAWNDWGNDQNTGWAIIDCMMNIPLLYWASKEINDPRFSYIAKSHADSTMENHIRPDGSVNHILVYDHINGGILKNIGGQGYEEGSSWSRGQAWGLYGFVLSYIHTGNEEYLDTAKRIAHYFIANVCDDYLTKCDFRSPKMPIIYDSTAGVIAACGLIEIAKVVAEYEKELYLNNVIKILKATNEKFCNWNLEVDNILEFCTVAYHRENERHIPIIYGDYYFAEAIYKLKGFDMLFW